MINVVSAAPGDLKAELVAGRDAHAMCGGHARQIYIGGTTMFLGNPTLTLSSAVPVTVAARSTTSKMLGPPVEVKPGQHGALLKWDAPSGRQAVSRYAGALLHARARPRNDLEPLERNRLVRVLVDAEFLRRFVEPIECGIDVRELRGFARRVGRVDLGVDRVRAEIGRVQRHLRQIAGLLLLVIRRFRAAVSLKLALQRRALLQKALFEMLELCCRECH